MSQLSASPIRMVASMAARVATGRAPGSPRHTGQTWVLGSAPKPVGQPQNIFVFVPSSTCTSRPITGSKRATTSSYPSVVVVVIVRSSQLGRGQRADGGLQGGR